MTLRELQTKNKQNGHNHSKEATELAVFGEGLLEVALGGLQQSERDYDGVNRFAVANFLAHTCSFEGGESPTDYLAALEEEFDHEVLIEAAAQFDNTEVMEQLMTIPAAERHEVALSVLDEVEGRHHREEVVKEAVGQTATKRLVPLPAPSQPEPAFALAA